MADNSEDNFLVYDCCDVISFFYLYHLYELFLLRSICNVVDMFMFLLQLVKHILKLRKGKILIERVDHSTLNSNVSELF